MAVLLHSRHVYWVRALGKDWIATSEKVYRIWLRELTARPEHYEGWMVVDQTVEELL